VIKRRKTVTIIAILAAVLLVGDAAGAEGMATIQQSNGSTRTYAHVHMHLAGRTLYLRSPDRRDTIEIMTNACSFAGSLERCLPYLTTLHKPGSTHTIALERGIVYVNTGATVAHLPHSSQGLGPKDVLVYLHTTRGTMISVRGSLDHSK
jgi:hypothetical protein